MYNHGFVLFPLFKLIKNSFFNHFKNAYFWQFYYFLAFFEYSYT